MLMPDTAFHLGPELERALNRMDFFRLFKALADSHDYRYFGLAELAGESETFNPQHAHSLHNFPDTWFPVAGDSRIGEDDVIVRHLQSSTASCSIDLKKMPSGLAGDSGAETAIVVPLHTTTGKRYGLVMFGKADRPRHEKLAVIAHDAALIFQRYCEAILSPDSISGLNDREIQIVRWTAEGKTSAEVAIILGLSEHTINSYIAAILRKLHVVNRAQLVASAMRSGLIS